MEKWVLSGFQVGNAMDAESRSGRMAQFMRATGTTTLPAARAA